MLGGLGVLVAVDGVDLGVRALSRARLGVEAKHHVATPDHFARMQQVQFVLAPFWLGYVGDPDRAGSDLRQVEGQQDGDDAGGLLHGVGGIRGSGLLLTIRRL